MEVLAPNRMMEALEQTLTTKKASTKLTHQHHQSLPLKPTKPQPAVSPQWAPHEVPHGAPHFQPHVAPHGGYQTQQSQDSGIAQKEHLAILPIVAIAVGAAAVLLLIVC